MLRLPQFIAHRSTGSDRAVGFDDIPPAIPNVLRAIVGKLPKIAAVELLQDVFELVRDPLTTLKSGPDGDRCHHQSGLIAVKCRAGSIVGLAKRYVDANAHNDRSRLGDALVLCAEGWRTPEQIFDFGSKLGRDLNRCR